MNAEARFAEKYTPEALTGCWLWTAGKSRDGYGKFKANGRDWIAHRFSFYQEYGALTPGLVVDHKCRNRSCVNPAHLREITASQNTGETPHTLAKRAQVVCKRGHVLPAPSLSGRKYGKVRWCRKCRVCESMRENKHA